MKLLVLTSEPVTADQLRDALTVDTDPAETEVMVVAPALAEGPLKFWFSEVDEAIARAQRVRSETVERLAGEGVQVAGTTGESEPMQAIQDALQRFPADRIVLFAHGEEDAQRYREDVDPAEVQERFGLPVDRARLPEQAAE